VGKSLTTAYVDTGVLIYLFEGIDVDRRDAEALLDVYRDTELCTSLLVLAERLVNPVNRADVVLADDYRRWHEEHRVLEIDRSVAELAAEVRAATELPLPDAMHLAVALSHDWQEIWTSDRRLIRAAGSYDILLRTP